MVAIRAVRQGIEILFAAGAVTSLNRIEVAALAGEDGTGEVSVSRQGVEVLSDAGAILSLNRIEMAALTSEDGTGEVQASRQGIEVLAEAGAVVGLNRIEMATLAGEDGTGEVQVSRQGIEVLFRVSILPGAPLPLPAGFEMFLQNWLDGFTVEGAYMTDVTMSQSTGAQERRALRLKPLRNLSLEFLNDSKAQIDRLLVVLRRLTMERFPFPLFCDEAPLNGSTTTSNNYVLCDTRYRRFYQNARVLVAPTSSNHVTAATANTYIIQEVQSDRLVFTTNLSANVSTGFSAYPLVDCEVNLESEASMATHHVAKVSLSMFEVLGANTLPPTRSDTPDGFTKLEGYPIFRVALGNDFSGGVDVSFRRDGTSFTRGRAPVVSSNVPKWLMNIRWNIISIDRASAWSMIQFFDSRRGRARSFWVMDEEDLWTVLSVQPTFISLDPFGEFDDIQDIEVIGIEMQDGTIHARRVQTIQEILGVWRLTTTGDVWPSLNTSEIRRVARVRLSNFDQDNLVERWSTLETCQFSFRTIENDDEGEKTL